MDGRVRDGGDKDEKRTWTGESKDVPRSQDPKIQVNNPDNRQYKTERSGLSSLVRPAVFFFFVFFCTHTHTLSLQSPMKQQTSLEIGEAERKGKTGPGDMGTVGS